MKKVLLTLVLTAVSLAIGTATFAKSDNNFKKNVYSYIVVDDGQMPSVDYTNYLNAISEIARKTWRPQSCHKNISVTVITAIRNDGFLKRYKVVKSSGYEKVDITALAALQVNSPFEEFPAGATEKYIKATFVFDRYLTGNANKRKHVDRKTYTQNNTIPSVVNTPQGNQNTYIPYNQSSLLLEPTYQDMYVYSQLVDITKAPLCKQYLDYVTSTIQKVLVVNDADAPLSYFRFNIKEDGMVENIKLITSQDGKVFAENIAIQINSIIFNKFPPELKFKDNKVTVEYKIGQGTLDGASFAGEFTPFTEDDVKKEMMDTQPKLREIPMFVPIPNDEITL